MKSGLKALLLCLAVLLPPRLEAFSRLFMGTLAVKPVVRFIAGARFSLDVEIFHLTDKRIIRALKTAAERGVAIRLILDPGQRRNLNLPWMLKDPRIQIRWMPTKKETGQLMHAKAACADQERVLMGSANWTYTGLTHNHEALVVMDEKGMAIEFFSAFEKDWAACVASWPARDLSDEELGALPDPKGFYEDLPHYRRRHSGAP